MPLDYLLRMRKKFVIFSTIFLFFTLISPVPSSAQTLVVKEGAPCSLIDPVSTYKNKIDRLYAWDDKKGDFFHFRCLRTDAFFPNGASATCGSRVKAKYLRKVKGPECVWKMSVNTKTKKPYALEANVVENQNCLDSDGYPEDQFVFMVKNQQLSFYRCFRDPGVWQLIVGPGSKSSDNNSNSVIPNKTQPANLAQVCRGFADAIIEYDFQVSRMTSQFLVQTANRKLIIASSNLMDVTLSDRRLAPLQTAANIMSKYTQEKLSRPRVSTVDPNVLQMNVNTFNSYCGTSIYIAP
jgi:hypothetical protein